MSSQPAPWTTKSRTACSKCVTYAEADPSDPASFDRLKKRLEQLEAARNTGGNRLFYLATPPGAFASIARQLGRVGLVKEDHGAWRRLAKLS
jgi:glucose-6-phosphate 1-dehydrogenase